MSKFKDIGKPIKNLLSDDFDAGEVSLSYSSKTKGGVGLSIDAIKGEDKGVPTFTGSVETDFNAAPGVGIKTKFNNSNLINAELSIANKLVKGSKLVVKTTIDPVRFDIKSKEINPEFKHGPLHFTAAISPGKSSSADVAYKHDAALVGVKASLTPAFGLKSWNAGLAYSQDKVSVAAILNDAKSADVYASYALNPDVTLASQAKVSFASSALTGAAGVSVNVDKDSFYKAKLSLGNSTTLDLAYVQKVCCCCEVGFSANINLLKFQSDSHSLGLSLNIDN